MVTVTFCVIVIDKLFCHKNKKKVHLMYTKLCGTRPTD